MVQILTTLMLAFFWTSCGNTNAGDNTQEIGSAEKTSASMDLGNRVTEKANKQPKVAESPVIKFEVEGLQAQSVFLIGMYTDQRYRADSARADNQGRFVFKRQKPYDAGLYFAVFTDNTYIQFLVDNDQTFTMKTTKSKLVNDMVVEGSLDNQLLYDDLIYQLELNPQYNKIKRDLKKFEKRSPEYRALKKEQDGLNDQKVERLEAQFKKYPNTLYTSFKRAGQNPELKKIKGADGKIDEVAQVIQYRKDFWDGVDFRDERLLYTPVVKNKLERYFNDLTPQQPDSIKSAVDHLMAKIPTDMKENKFYSYFTNWVGLKYEPGKAKLMDSEAVYVHMVQKYYNYNQAFWADSAQIYALQLRAHEMAGSLIGNKAPDVKSRNPEGKLKSIGEIDDDYIIVYMYNPQCEHCAIETPKLVNWYREWKPKGAEVFAIAIDTDEVEWKGYVKKNKMNFINVYDPSNQSIYGKYYVNITPELYVIGPDRTIIGKNLKVSQIETIINKDKEKRGG